MSKIVASGPCTLSIDGETFEVGAGQLIIGKPRTLEPSEEMLRTHTVAIEFTSIEWNIENLRVCVVSLRWLRRRAVRKRGAARKRRRGWR